MRSSITFVLLGTTVATTSAFAAVLTLSPSSAQPIVPCSIQTLVWTDDGSYPLIWQIGTSDLVLLQDDNTLQIPATVGERDASSGLSLPCRFPSTNDYISYVPHSSVYASSSYQIGAIPDAERIRPAGKLDQAALAAPASAPSEQPTAHLATRDFDVMAPAPPVILPQSSTSGAAQPTNPPPTRAAYANRAVASRGVGIHPGLVVMWAGVMCGMMMF